MFTACRSCGLGSELANDIQRLSGLVKKLLSLPFEGGTAERRKAGRVDWVVLTELGPGLWR